MKPSRRWDIRSRKWRRCLGVAVVEDAAAVVAEATVVVVEEAQDKLKPKHLDIKVPNTRTYPRVNGGAVRCTSGGGAELTFAASRLHARGRTSLPKSQPNETGTSPVNLQE